nr:LCP family protein [Lactobacillus corticis]
MSEEIKRSSGINRNHHHHHHRHHKRWLKWLGVLAIFVVVVLACFGVLAYRNVRNASNNMYNKSNKTTSGLTSQMNASKPISILVMGTDTGALGRSYKGRTDTIMMITLNPKTHKTLIVSVPRDMKVNLPGYSQYSPSKINAAYTYGGVDETISVIKNEFSVPIYAYGLINMGGLEKAINQVGGVDVKSPLTFSYEGYSFKKNVTYHMNGKKALAFSRMRYDDPRGDYGRQERQRLVVMALLKESASYRTLLNNEFLDSVSKQVQTDLSLNSMLKLATSYRSALGTIKSDHAQGTTSNIDGVSFEVVSKSERQRVSNEVRKSLGLKTKTVE